MHLEIHGNVSQVIVVEAGASPTIHIGSGRASVYGGGGSVSNRCPIRAINATQRTEWAKRCIGATAPDGWTVESFSSEKAFTGSIVPSGVTKGDPIFFWKKIGVETSAPDGFELVYLSDDGIGIIVPAATSHEVDEEFSFTAQDSMSEEDDEDEENNDDSPPPPPSPQETSTLSLEED